MDLVIVILLLFWMVGAFAAPFGGNLIHLLFVVALVLIIMRLVRGRPLP